jgi:hypothetical protein
MNCKSFKSALELNWELIKNELKMNCESFKSALEMN